MQNQTQLYAVVDALLAAGNVAANIVEEGSLSVTEVPALTGLLPSLLTALADLKAVPAALESMTAADAEALIAHVVANLSISNAKAKTIINAALAVANDLVALYTAIK